MRQGVLNGAVEFAYALFCGTGDAGYVFEVGIAS